MLYFNVFGIMTATCGGMQTESAELVWFVSKLDCAVVKTHFKLLCICMVLIRLPLFDHVINKASLKFIVLKVGKEAKTFRLSRHCVQF